MIKGAGGNPTEVPAAGGRPFLVSDTEEPYVDYVRQKLPPPLFFISEHLVPIK